MDKSKLSLVLHIFDVIKLLKNAVFFNTLSRLVHI